MAEAADGKIALQGLTPDDVASALPGLAMVQARRLVSRIHRDGELGAPHASLERVTRERALAAFSVPTLTVLSEQRSRIDPFVKYALRTDDGHVIEAVRIPLEKPGRFVVCVSSQVGCALACTFCATGRMGLTRNLETWEIVEQIRVVRRGLVAEGHDGRVHGVVFQGMGEPLANADRVLQAIRVFSDPSACAIDQRNITVCTSGLPAGIRRLAASAPRVRLGLSIGTARAGARKSLMPIDRANPLDEVLDAAAEHVAATGLAPMWAVTLLAGVNDGDEDAAALATLVHAFTAKAGKRPRLSVIPYNAIDASPDGTPDPFVRTSDAAETAFRDALRARGVFTHKRYSGGGDVGAACGQLAARV